MPLGAAPKVMYFVAAGVSFATAGVVIVGFLAIGPTLMTTWLVPPLACALLSLAFAFRWPAGSWRWGIWLSMGFWAFFLVIFISYLLTGTIDRDTPLRAAAVLVAAMAAAAAGANLRHRLA